MRSSAIFALGAWTAGAIELTGHAIDVGLADGREITLPHFASAIMLFASAPLMATCVEKLVFGRKKEGQPSPGG